MSLTLIFTALLLLLVWWICTMIKYIPEEYKEKEK
jgi:hypothetical protein